MYYEVKMSNLTSAYAVVSALRINISMMGKITADNILKYFSYFSPTKGFERQFAENILKYLSNFSQKTGIDILCKLTICIKCQSLLSGNKRAMMPFFFFDLGFTVLSRIFHLYQADHSSKVGENRRTQGKTT